MEDEWEILSSKRIAEYFDINPNKEYEPAILHNTCSKEFGDPLTLEDEENCYGCDKPVSKKYLFLLKMLIRL